MGKPKLSYDRITKEILGSVCGQWMGSYLEDEKRVPVDLSLMANGSWASRSLRPDMKHGHWYLWDGMILLFEGPLFKKETDLFSDLTLRNGKLRLFLADAPKGYVKLERSPRRNEARQRTEANRNEIPNSSLLCRIAAKSPS